MRPSPRAHPDGTRETRTMSEAKRGARTVVWREIPATDMDRAMGFCAELLQTKLTRNEQGPNPIAKLPGGGGYGDHLHPGKPAPAGTGSTIRLAAPGKLEAITGRVRATGGELFASVVLDSYSTIYPDVTYREYVRPAASPQSAPCPGAAWPMYRAPWSRSGPCSPSTGPSGTGTPTAGTKLASRTCVRPLPSMVCVLSYSNHGGRRVESARVRTTGRGSSTVQRSRRVWSRTVHAPVSCVRSTA